MASFEVSKMLVNQRLISTRQSHTNVPCPLRFVDERVLIPLGTRLLVRPRIPNSYCSTHTRQPNRNASILASLRENSYGPVFMNDSIMPSTTSRQNRNSSSVISRNAPCLCPGWRDVRIESLFMIPVAFLTFVLLTPSFGASLASPLASSIML